MPEDSRRALPESAAATEAAAFFGPQGVLARAHAGYEPRPGQQIMAGAVARVLADGGRLLVEAGTGTGKTLAYLVPALQSGRRVIVSTGTRNLQDQIAERDLPFLARETGLDVSACVMKGRENYVCRYRLGQLEREPLLHDVREAPWIGRIAAWSRSTATGDRAEIADLPDDLLLWRDVNARADTCGGARCPEYEACWLTRLKRRAAGARLVVVNHHLFFADLALRSAFGAVLPDYDAVVFDEAHRLEEVATQYFGKRVSSAQLEELARSAERLAAACGGPARGGGGADELRRATAELAAGLDAAPNGGGARVRFEPAARGGPDLEAEWAVLSTALDEVARRVPDRTDDPGAEALRFTADAVREALDVILARDAADLVYGRESAGRGRFRLSASPIDVSGALRDALFEPLHAVVLTSATLSVDGRFEFVRSRLGVERSEDLIVGTSFDPERQAVLYLPARLPDPRSPGWFDRAVAEIVALLEVTGGRAFLLFTSHAMLRRVRDVLAEVGRWPLVAQGDGSRAALVERFRSTPGAVLLGAASFWQGVDVPGEALSLVVVDKLPFAVPSDPLTEARIRHVREAGADPFHAYQVPLAVLDLKQGLGRLLRSRRDRGIVCVLDGRLTARPYGRLFLRSLPPYRTVRSIAECRAFFAATEEEPA